jgi:hypothetical protein
MGGGRKSKSKSKSKSKPKTKAQKMAVANKAKYGGTAKAAAANKASMKAKAKAKHTASQAAKKSAPKSISKGTTGIGPVKSGKTYSKAVSTAKNQPKKKTSGIGPVASGSAYAKSLSTAKNQPTKKTSGVGPVASGKEYAAALKASPPKVAKAKFTAAPKDVAMLGGDNLGSIIGTGAVIGASMSLPGMIKNAIDAGGKLRENIEKRVNPDADKVSAIGNLGGLGIAPVSAATIKSPDTFGYPSQAEVDKAAGITAGGLNIGGSGFTPSNPSGSNARAIKPTGNPAVMSADGTFNRPGPGGPEPEADYTSYQPGSFYNQSDTNMNPTNFLRSTRNVVTTPARMLGINNRFTNMLIPKSNEAIQDARDQRGPRPTLTRRGGGGGARLPVAPLTPEEILLPEVAQVAQTGPAYQQIEGQTGVDPNRLMQIQQEAYAQAFNPYNPLTVGGFNPFFRFFGRRGGGRRGAFRKAFRRD